MVSLTLLMFFLNWCFFQLIKKVSNKKQPFLTANCCKSWRFRDSKNSCSRHFSTVFSNKWWSKKEQHHSSAASETTNFRGRDWLEKRGFPNLTLRCEMFFAWQIRDLATKKHRRNWIRYQWFRWIHRDSGESTCNSKIKKGFSAGTVHKAAVAADASLTLVDFNSNRFQSIDLQAYDKSHQLMSVGVVINGPS